MREPRVLTMVLTSHLPSTSPFLLTVNVISEHGDRRERQIARKARLSIGFPALLLHFADSRQKTCVLFPKVPTRCSHVLFALGSRWLKADRLPGFSVAASPSD
ncbi:hypothetical protein MTO96_038106 [Rhipicephalus appendiculatus]